MGQRRSPARGCSHRGGVGRLCLVAQQLTRGLEALRRAAGPVAAPRSVCAGQSTLCRPLLLLARSLWVVLARFGAAGGGTCAAKATPAARALLETRVRLREQEPAHAQGLWDALLGGRGERGGCNHRVKLRLLRIPLTPVPSFHQVMLAVTSPPPRLFRVSVKLFSASSVLSESPRSRS